MNRSVKISLAGLLLASLASSCGGEKPAAELPNADSLQHVQHVKAPIHLEPHAAPGGELVTVEYSQHALDSLFALPATERPATPEAAAHYHLSMPPKMTVMPHMLPGNQIKLLSETDSTATFEFVAQNGPMKGLLMLRKVSQGGESMWIVQQAQSLQPTP